MSISGNIQRLIDSHIDPRMLRDFLEEECKMMAEKVKRENQEELSRFREQAKSESRKIVQLEREDIATRRAGGKGQSLHGCGDKPKLQSLVTKEKQPGQQPKAEKKIENIRGSANKGGKKGKGKQSIAPPWKEPTREKVKPQEEEGKEGRKALVFANPASSSRTKVTQQAGQVSHKYCGA